MSPAARPEAVSFAPGSGEILPPLGPALTDPDTRLLIIVAPDAGDAALRTATELAEARAREGHGTVLTDASFDDPRLHRLLDVPNVEGLGDVFEFGASLERVMTRPATWAFDFVPAGPYVPNAGAVLRSPRWDRLTRHVADTFGSLLVFVPADAPGLDALSRRADGAILVGDARGVERAANALDEACEIVAVVEPEGPLTPSVLAARAGRADDISATIFDQPHINEPIVFRGEESPRDVRRYARLVVLALATLVLGWCAYSEFTAAPTTDPFAAQETAPAAPAEAPPPPQPVETPIGFSVAVEAHQDLEAALERRARLSNAASGIQFYLAPVSVNGSLFFRVLAGPVSDRESARVLMRRLVDEGHKTAFDDWAIRPTPFAFLLGEFTTREQAEQRVAELLDEGIPTHVIPIRYEPGEPRYRVYGGAFESGPNAMVMEEMLRDAGIDARLTERVGEPLEVGG